MSVITGISTTALSSTTTPRNVRPPAEKRPSLKLVDWAASAAPSAAMTHAVANRDIACLLRPHTLLEFGNEDRGHPAACIPRQGGERCARVEALRRGGGRWGPARLLCRAGVRAVLSAACGCRRREEPRGTDTGPHHRRVCRSGAATSG